MPRKFDIAEMKAKLAKYDERKRDTEKALSKIESSRKELVARIAAEERKERTHNLCEVGGLVYRYFGENLTDEQFKVILDVLFKMNGVQEFVNAEKDKRALAEIERAESITYDVDGSDDEEEDTKLNQVVIAVREKLVLNAGRMN